MTPVLVLALLGLSLIDSTSFGTLLIPVWLLLAPGRLRAGRVVVYLGTVAGCYLALGVLLLAGAGALIDTVTGLAGAVPAEVLRGGQLAVGAFLIWWSYRLEARAKQVAGEPGRLQRWRSRAMSGTGSVRALLALALLAVGLEVATMLPYLAAIGLLVTAELAVSTTVAALAGYCLVMVVPALVLTAARVVAHRWVDPALHRLNSWLSRNTGKLLGWTVGGAGVWLCLNALANLTFG